MTRKDFLRLSAALPAAAVAPGADPAPSRPNVLVLMSDQHRPDYMTCAGNDIVPTPHLDRLAAEGVRFTRAICPYPVCAASRASLMTGLYAHTHGCINNTDHLAWDRRTVAHHFHDAGYLTGLIGKMHFGDGMQHGFDYRLGFNDWLMYLGPKVQLYANDIANHQLGDHFFHSVNDNGSGFPAVQDLWPERSSPWAGHVRRKAITTTEGIASDLEEEDSIDRFVARETVKFLERHSEEPFFLIAGFLRPHPPLHPPRPWHERYPVERMSWPGPGDVSGYPLWIQQRIERMARRGEPMLKSHRAGYLGNLAYFDEVVGDVLGALDRLGLRDNTIVVYTSDHGEMDGEHGLLQKFCLFDPSISLPLIVSHPSLPSGKVSQAQVSYFSLYPTLAELCGLPAPEGIEAESFAASCRNPDARGPEAVFAEFNNKGPVPCYMARTDRWKYVWNDGDKAELYDLEADPGELRNRAGEAGLRKVEGEMKDRLLGWYDPAENPWAVSQQQP